VDPIHNPIPPVAMEKVKPQQGVENRGYAWGVNIPADVSEKFRML